MEEVFKELIKKTGNIKGNPYTTVFGVIFCLFSMAFGVFAFIKSGDLSLYSLTFAIIFLFLGAILLGAKDPGKKDNCKIENDEDKLA